MNWQERFLRGNRVFAEADDAGVLVTDDSGRVAIVYSQKEGAKVYRAAAKNLHKTAPSKPQANGSKSKGNTAGKKAASKGARDDARFRIYTDGACSGNPGPAGSGVLLMGENETRHVARSLGQGTNNIAELEAIRIGLTLVPESQRHETVDVFTDSSYSIGVLSQGWKAKANKELIASIKKLMADFGDLHLVKVKGHAGDPYNELADELARRGAAGETVDEKA